MNIVFIKPFLSNWIFLYSLLDCSKMDLPKLDYGYELTPFFDQALNFFFVDGVFFTLDFPSFNIGLSQHGFSKLESELLALVVFGLSCEDLLLKSRFF